MTKVTFRNFTPHPIVLNDGTVYESEGEARLSQNYSEFDENNISTITYGEITGLPEPEEGVYYIVSSFIKQNSDRDDLVIPATGHKDCVRDEKKFIKSVPGFFK